MHAPKCEYDCGCENQPTMEEIMEALRPMHAPEPWTAIHLDDQWCEIYCPGHKIDGRFTIADGERIVACVNACRGIPTEWLSRLDIKSLIPVGGFDQDDI